MAVQDTEQGQWHHGQVRLPPCQCEGKYATSHNDTNYVVSGVVDAQVLHLHYCYLVAKSIASESLPSKPKLKPVWQFFVIAEDIEYTKCCTCNKLIARGEVSMIP